MVFDRKYIFPHWSGNDLYKPSDVSTDTVLSDDINGDVTFVGTSGDVTFVGTSEETSTKNKNTTSPQ